MFLLALVSLTEDHARACFSRQNRAEQNRYSTPASYLTHERLPANAVAPGSGSIPSEDKLKPFTP